VSPINVDAVTAVEGLSFFKTEIPPKYRDKSLWMPLGFGCFGIAFGRSGFTAAGSLTFGGKFDEAVELLAVEEHRHAKVLELDSAVVDWAVGLSRL